MPQANNEQESDDSKGYGIVDPANLYVAKSKKEIKEELRAWAKLIYEIYQERKRTSQSLKNGV